MLRAADVMSCLALCAQVNMCPSLSSSSPMDRNIKNTLMVDVFHLVGFVPVDRRTMGDEISKGKLERMLSRSRGSGADACCCGLRPLSANATE